MVKTVERKHRKTELLRLMAARSDFSGAKHAAEMLIQHAPRIGSDLNYPLLVAAIVCYSRPFTNNKPYGMLPGRYLKLLNEPLTALHNEITDARDRYFAHSDLSQRSAYIFPKGSIIAPGPPEVLAAGLSSALEFQLYAPETLGALVDTCRIFLDQIRIDLEALLTELYGGMELPVTKFHLTIDNGL